MRLCRPFRLQTRLCSSASFAATSATSPVSACRPLLEHRTLNTRAGPIGSVVKAVAASFKSSLPPTCPNLDPQLVKTERIQHPTKSPPEISLWWAVLNPKFSTLFLVAAATAKIQMKSRKADVASATAVVAGTVTGIVAAMPGAMVRVIAVLTGVMMTGVASMVTGTVTTGVSPIVAGAVPASVTGTARVVVVSRLHCGGSEDCKACSDSQDDDELFHGAVSLSSSCRHPWAAYKSDALPTRLFS